MTIFYGYYRFLHDLERVETAIFGREDVLRGTYNVRVYVITLTGRLFGKSNSLLLRDNVFRNRFDRFGFIPYHCSRSII